MTHRVGCPASFTQIAGVEALTGPQDEVDAVVGKYQHRRDFLVGALNKIPGWSCRPPQGAFYVFPNVSSYGKTASWWAEFLLEEAGVAVLPGTAFGRYGEGYIRLCFCNSMENICEAMDRIAGAVARL
ncbi:MAG: pyridoxal phosphate-dependent aminotransferase [Nitrososphaerales archaeon]